LICECRLEQRLQLRPAQGGEQPEDRDLPDHVYPTYAHESGCVALKAGEQVRRQQRLAGFHVATPEGEPTREHRGE